MKKWIALLLVFALLFAMGCKKNEPVAEVEATPTPEVTAAPAPTPTPVPEETPTPTPTPTPEADVYTYVSEIYGFTITMPDSWRDCCIIEEGNMQTSFYSAANRYTEIGGEVYDTGLLFTVLVPEDSMKDGEGYIFPNYKVIGQIGPADILVVYPSDVQIGDFENQEAVEEYSRMSEETAEVVSSITFG